jgi:hypothetical protein
VQVEKLQNDTAANIGIMKITVLLLIKEGMVALAEVA